MELNEWSIQSNGLDEKKRFSRDALFTVGNGYFGIRGFFEEDNVHPIGRLGGIYMAGIFGKGVQEVCSGPSRELCNLPNALRIHLIAGSSVVTPRVDMEFSQELCMQNGVYTRNYLWGAGIEPTLHLSFERFVSLDTEEAIWQRVTVTAIRTVEVELTAAMDGDVTNLNAVSGEPLPVQPGRNHFSHCKAAENTLTVELDDETATVLTLVQSARLMRNGQEVPMQDTASKTECGSTFCGIMAAGDCISLEKVVCVNKGTGGTSIFPDYTAALKRNTQAWEKRWYCADIDLNGPCRDQCALRYNLFELMAACPLHSEYASIGARGLSGEMYEGCVFWDNEIFQLPFFLWTEPEAARRLLRFRYHTLPEAEKRAKELWFEGALYPWQVSEAGREQTIREGGAYYAIHITADVAFALKNYCEITGDYSLLRDGGAEILVQTARFWASRCDFDPTDGQYHIRAVRGPNEYDVYVDDNAYTNIMAAENLRGAEWALTQMEKTYTLEYVALSERIGITVTERKALCALASRLAIPKDRQTGLILEDSRYASRRFMDLKRAKPTEKRIIDTTLPYEALPLYQITKQADVVLLMNLLPGCFTEQEKALAYDYYEPRTAHDSSLSYAPHGWLCARLGRCDEAYRYFEKSALLDVEDRQLNTVSGLHYANFGGTWQMVFRGFMGIEATERGIVINPKLPSVWQGFSLRCYYQGTLLRISAEGGVLRCTAEDMAKNRAVRVLLAGSTFVLTCDSPSAEVREDEK